MRSRVACFSKGIYGLPGGTCDMKRIISMGLIFIIIVTLAACSAKGDSPRLLTKEGIAPYELSEGEKYVVQSFGSVRMRRRP
jgi:hypothetical protein